MSEFEFVYMINQIEDTMWSHIMNFISIMFAMLVTAYFIAARLTKAMTLALLSLFSLGAALFFGSAVTSRRDHMTLAVAARKKFLDGGSELPSLNMFNASDLEIMAMNVLLAVILASAYVATLVFFVQARSQKP